MHIMDWAVDLLTVPATNITPLSALQDTTYQIGTGAFYLNMPLYDPNPYNAVMILVSSVSAGPAFVTIDSSTQPPRVKIQTAAFGDTGTYTVEVIITETNSGVVDVQTF